MKDLCVVIAKTVNGPSSRLEIFLLADESDPKLAAEKLAFLLKNQRGSHP